MIRKWIPWILAAITILCCLSFIRRGGDFSGYLLVGEQVAKGGHIYTDVPARINTWPPFFSLLCYPLYLLSRPSIYLARGFWLALNCWMLFLSLNFICKLVYRQKLVFHATDQSDEISVTNWEILVPLLACGRFVVSNFQHLQINLVLLALTVAGLYLHSKQRDLQGGICLGLAIAVKVIPVLFVPYFLYRRRWRMAFASIIATLLFSLSPILFFGWERLVDYLQSWQKALELGWGVGFMNQSVLAMWDRSLPLTFSEFVYPAYLGTVLIVTMAAILSFRGEYRPGSPSTLTEWSIVSAVMVLFGPVAWKAFFVFFLLPFTVLLAVWNCPQIPSRARRVAGIVLVAVSLVSLVSMPALLGRSTAEILQEWSILTILSLSMLAVLFWLKFQVGGLDFFERKRIF